MQVCHNCGYTNWEESDEVVVDEESAKHPQVKVEPGTVTENQLQQIPELNKNLPAEIVTGILEK
jgi:hypothetical protein